MCPFLLPKQDWPRLYFTKLKCYFLNSYFSWLCKEKGHSGVFHQWHPAKVHLVKTFILFHQINLKKIHLNEINKVERIKIAAPNKDSNFIRQPITAAFHALGYRFSFQRLHWFALLRILVIITTISMILLYNRSKFISPKTSLQDSTKFLRLPQTTYMEKGTLQAPSLKVT